jgi:hypothetical protein
MSLTTCSAGSLAGLDFCLIFTPSTGYDEPEFLPSYRFADVIPDDRRMPLVFQAFVRNFFALEQTRFKVGAMQIPWDAVPEGSQAAALLPRMNTDIVLLISTVPHWHRHEVLCVRPL